MDELMDAVFGRISGWKSRLASGVRCNCQGTVVGARMSGVQAITRVGLLVNSICSTNAMTPGKRTLSSGRTSSRGPVLKCNASSRPTASIATAMSSPNPYGE